MLCASFTLSQILRVMWLGVSLSQILIFYNGGRKFLIINGKCRIIDSEWNIVFVNTLITKIIISNDNVWLWYVAYSFMNLEPKSSIWEERPYSKIAILLSFSLHSTKIVSKHIFNFPSSHYSGWSIQKIHLVILLLKPQVHMLF